MYTEEEEEEKIECIYKTIKRQCEKGRASKKWQIFEGEQRNSMMMTTRDHFKRLVRQYEEWHSNRWKQWKKNTVFTASNRKTYWILSMPWWKYEKRQGVNQNVIRISEATSHCYAMWNKNEMRKKNKRIKRKSIGISCAV